MKLTPWLLCLLGLMQLISAADAQNAVARPLKPEVPELICPAKPKLLKNKSAPPPKALHDPNDPLVVPDAEEVALALASGNPSALNEPPRNSLQLQPPASGGLPYKVAIWGDSHMAAGMFSNRLKALSQLPPERISTRWLPASFGRAGVRLPIQKVCVNGEWRYEVQSKIILDTKTTLGPGLITMSASQAGANLALDLRAPKSGTSGIGWPQVTLHLQRLIKNPPEPLQFLVRINGETAQRMDLPATPASPHTEAWTLSGSTLDSWQRNIQTLQIELVTGSFALQGIELPLLADTALQMDVFGIPGAQATSWRNVTANAWQTWWSEQEKYDLIVLAYGTNEGNQSPFDASKYEADMQQTLQTVRQQFPTSSCLLLAPGDRGVLVRRSSRQHKISKISKISKTSGQPTTKPRPAITQKQLLQYAHIHAAIGQIQAKIAPLYQCQTWSAQTAMGGVGSSYQWQRQQPALMAKDLIHFTPLGYQTLAELFANDVDWSRLF